MSTIEVSDADQVMVSGSTLFTSAGSWNMCTPSTALYIGEKRTSSAGFSQPVTPGLLDPPAPPPPPGVPPEPASPEPPDPLDPPLAVAGVFEEEHAPNDKTSAHSA